jgi:hypothetical protein
MAAIAPNILSLFLDCQDYSAEKRFFCHTTPSRQKRDRITAPLGRNLVRPGSGVVRATLVNYRARSDCVLTPRPANGPDGPFTSNEALRAISADEFPIRTSNVPEGRVSAVASERSETRALTAAVVAYLDSSIAHSCCTYCDFIISRMPFTIPFSAHPGLRREAVPS